MKERRKEEPRGKEGKRKLKTRKEAVTRSQSSNGGESMGFFGFRQKRKQRRDHSPFYENEIRKSKRRKRRKRKRQSRDTRSAM